MRRVKLVRPRGSRPHGIVNVSVLEIRSRPDHAAVGRGVPKVSVPQPVIVTEFVRGDSRTHALEPDTLAAYVSQPAEGVSRHRGERHNVAIIIRRVISR